MTSAMPTGSDQRLRPIDGLRGIAVLLVMQYHYWGLAYGLFSRPSTLGIDEFVDDVMKFGWIGVDLFFVLSGFLITGILLDVKGRGGYFRSFYARRALRILPPYYLFLLFVIVVIPLVPVFSGGFEAVAQSEALREDQFWFWTFLLNIGTSFVVFDMDAPFTHGHFWTLAVEEQFYLVWPMVVLLVARARLVYVCFGLIVTAFLFRIAFTEGAWSSVLTEQAVSLLPSKMDTLAFGALIAIAVRDGSLERLTRFAPAGAIACAAIIVVLAFRNGGFLPGDIEVIQWGYLPVAVLFACVVMLALEAQPSSLMFRGLTTPALLEVGRYSYVMYIVHILVGVELARQVAVNDWWGRPGGTEIPFNIVFCLVATAITFGIAWVSWRVLEQPILAQKRRFTYDAPASKPSEPIAAQVIEGGAK